MIKKRILLLITITILLFTLLGCDVINNNEGNSELIDNGNDIIYEPSYGGNITLPLYNVKTLNPLITSDKSQYFFNKLIFEGLFEFDEKLGIKNLLADSYEIENEGKLLKIKLKENVYWHSDENNEMEILTSHDVKFTIDVLKYGSGNSVYKELFQEVFKNSKISKILKTKVVDDYNLTIEFDKSYSNALESLTFPIIAKHQFTSFENVNKYVYNKALNPKLDLILKGTGPYKIAEFNKNKNIILEANEKWWDDKPYIENVTGLVLTDSDYFITAFESGRTDLSITKDLDWKKYYERKNISIYEYLTQKYEFLAFNFNNEFFKGESGKNIRKAIAHAIDLNTIIQKEYYNHAIKTNTPLLPGSWLTDEKYNYGYDTEKAKRLLKEAGFEDKNDDGILEDINGNELRFKFLTNSDNKQRVGSANIIVDNLREIGIDIISQYEMSPKNNSSWKDTLSKVYAGDYDIALLGWEMSYLPDLSFAFHSKNIKGGYNFINYNNIILDQLLNKANTTINKAKKKDIYVQIQDILYEELPYISLKYVNSSLLINNRIKGDINPLSFNIYNNIHKWYIPKELRK